MEYQSDNNIYFNIEVNELLAIIDITQSYTNNSENPIEMKIKLPNTDYNFIKLTAKINDDILIQSKIIEIEKAKEKYTDSISQGNTGLLTIISDNNFTVLNIGNLNPNDTIELTTTYYCLLSHKHFKIYNLKIDFDYPILVDQNFKEIDDLYENININTNIKFNMFYELISLNIDNLESSKYTKEFDDKNKKYRIIYNENVNTIIPLNINIEVNNKNEYILFTQNYPKLKNTAYFLNYKFPQNIVETLSNKNNIKSKSINPLFVFFLDQSGSMDGTPIELVKKSLKIFLHSLPYNAYFQLIGFGSNFKKYSEIPEEYSPLNIKNMDSLIDDLGADMNGTNLLNLIQNIDFEKDYINFKSAKNLFILTDGIVEDKNSVIYEITKNKKDFSIHALGYGENYDEDFIVQIGRLPNCTFHFVKKMKEINSKMIEILEMCDSQGINNITINCNIPGQIKLNDKINFLNINSPLKYGFISNIQNNGNINIDIEYEQEDIKSEIKLNFDEKNIIKLENGNILSRIIISNLLNTNNFSDEICLDLSLKYQILSKKTGLFAEKINYSNKNEKEIIPLTYIRRGKNYLFNNAQVKVNISKAKTGKHGHAKNYISYWDGKTNKRIDSMNELKIENKTNKINNNNISQYADLDIDNIVLSQDLMEGFWNKNDETDQIINLIKDIYNKAENAIKNLCVNYEKELIQKLLYTFLIIYFIENKTKERIPDFKLLIKKGKDFMKNNKVEYDIIFKNLMCL